MAVIRSHYTVFVHPVAVETGLWCGRCFLPSGIKVTFDLIDFRGASRKTLLRCNDCCEPLGSAAPDSSE